MTQLESLLIRFLPFAPSETGSSGRPVAVRATLPALTKFHFSGDRAYLVDLISRIDSPILEQLFKPSAFEIRQLSHFTSPQSLHTLAHRSILLLGDKIFFVNQLSTPPTRLSDFQLSITSKEINSKATLSHIFTQHSAILHQVLRVDLKSFLPRSPWLDPDEIDSALWVDFFRQLVSATALDVAVLPALYNINVGTSRCETPGPFEKFASARRASGLPIIVRYAVSQPTAKIHVRE